MSDTVTLSSSALLVLNDLKDDPKPARRYPDEDLEELRKANFIRDLPGGGIASTKEGLDFLMPPGKPRPYTPPVLHGNGHSAPTPPVSKPPAVTPPTKTPAQPSTGKLVGASFVIAALKKAGGSLTREALNADGRTLRKMLQEGQIVEEGDSIRLAKAVERVASPARPSAVPMLPSSSKTNSVRLPVEAPAPAQAIESAACTDECATCPTGRALAFLTHTSPALKAMVERFQAHEADQQRLQSFDS